MNILCLLNYAPEFGGGVAKHLDALGEVIRSNGDKIYLGFPEKRDWQNELSTNARIVIIPEIRKPLLSGFSKIIRSICINESIDLIHMHFKFAQPFALLLSFKKWEIPIVYHWHNPPESLNDFITPQNFKGVIKRIAAGVIARYTDRKIIKHHVTISKDITTLLLKNKWILPDKVTYLPNGIQRRNPIDIRSHLNTDSRKIIGTVANFRPEKDHKTLLEGFKLLIEVGLEAELWLIGDGPTRSGIEKLADDLNITTFVKFFGQLNDPSEVYKKFDVFVLSTRYEGYSLVLMEAMSFGLPIVASSVSSIPEVITNGLNGLLVKPGDAKELASAISSLLTDNQLRLKMSQASTENYNRQITHSEWARRLVSLYLRLLQ